MTAKVGATVDLMTTAISFDLEAQENRYRRSTPPRRSTSIFHRPARCGKDSEDVQVYSVNLTVATVLMNEEETIEALRVDTLEVASPNYDGEGMPHFSGWPGQGGYNYDEDHDGEIDEKTPDSLEWFLEEVELWLTKRDRGDDYQMVTGSWSDQMDAYQAHFTGMTLEEVEAWVAKHTSDVNGRPLKARRRRSESMPN